VTRSDAADAAGEFSRLGRDCWCCRVATTPAESGLTGSLGELPQGFDHKYTYSHVGYNLKATDMQAAVGRWRS